MTTFDPIPYTYVPTAPRSKSAAAHRKPASKKFTAPHERQHTKLRSTTPDSPRLPALATADPDRGYESTIQETSTFHDSSDDDDLPILEEILYPALHKEGFTTTDLSPDNADLQVEEVASRRGSSITHNKAAASDNSGSPDNPIDLRGDDDSSASEAEDDGGSPRAVSSTPDPGFFASSKPSISSTNSAPPSRSDGWYDIDDLPEIAPRLQLAEHGACTLNSMRPCSSASHLSSEPWHDRISKERCDTTKTHSDHVRSSPSRFSREPLEDALGQADHVRIGRSKATQHELPSSALDTGTVEEGGRQEAEQEDQDNDENDRGQFPVNGVAAVETAARVSDTMIDGGLGLAQRPRVPSDSSASHDETESLGDCDNDSDNDDEPDNRFASNRENRIPPRRKRKQPSSASESHMHKKRKFHFQHMSTRRLESNSKHCRRSPQSSSPRDQASKVAALSSGEGRLPSVVPSPMPSASQAMKFRVSSNHNDLSEPPGKDLPTLMEITFRPQSLHCFSFTAVFRDGDGERGVFFAQLNRLIESTGHIGKIDDLAIKPIEHQSFPVTGFSQHASSRLSYNRATISNTAKATSVHEDACDSDDENGLSESNSDLSGDDAGSSSEDQQVPSGPRQHSPWSDLDEKRLLAYKKEGKPWGWIFRKFPGRTQAAIRTRWSMVRLRND